MYNVGIITYDVGHQKANKVILNLLQLCLGQERSLVGPAGKLYMSIWVIFLYIYQIL